MKISGRRTSSGSPRYGSRRPARAGSTLCAFTHMVGGHPQGGAARTDSQAMRVPSPRRMPRLANVRLSIELGLCFGVILALTAAIIAVGRHNVQGLEKAHNRVTQAWSRASSSHSGPRRPLPTSTSPRPRWSSPTAALRSRRGGPTSRSSRRASDALRAMADDPSAIDARSTPPLKTVRGPGRQAVRARQARRPRRRHRARLELRRRGRRRRDRRHRHLHRPRQPRARGRPTRASPAPRPAPRA